VCWTLRIGLVTLLLISLFGFTTPVSAKSETVPPAGSIQDVKELAGDWEGWSQAPGRAQNLPVKLTIKSDGSTITTLTQGRTLTGSIYHSGGQILFKTSRPSGGTVTLHEAEGKRVLRLISADGVTTELTPIK
jgi:hypothetical protein